MSDHREPVAMTVSIPNPSSANVPCTDGSEQTSATFDKENVNSVVQSPNTDVSDDKLESGKTTLTAVTPSSKEESSSEEEITATGIPLITSSNTSVIQTPPCGLEISSLQTPQNTFCHSLTSVVPIITQAPLTSTMTSTIPVAHSLISLLPKIINPVATCNSVSYSSPSTVSTGIPPNVLKPITATNLQTPLRALGTSSRPKAPVEEPVPDFIPEFLPGKIDAKKFPAKHFELGTLEIGQWKYELRPNGSFTPTTSRLKVIFSQRKFVYEFEQRSIDSSGTMAMFQKEKLMACIEVPFKSIAGLNMSKESPCYVVIEVNAPPLMYVGKQVLWSPSTGCALPTKYDTSNPVDLTMGQLLTVPYHKLKLSNNHLRTRLQSFDPRFDALLRTPITMDLSKRLSQIVPSVQPTKHGTPSEHTVGSTAPKRSRKSKSPSSSMTGESTSSCTCASGCKKQICGCFKINGKCGSECKCVTCQNPFNILVDNGVDIEEARKDECLMNNITMIEDLDTFMKSNTASMPCCDTNVLVKDVCIGVVSCPECKCGEYRYSWCDFSLRDDKCKPRNHCPICKRCGDYRDDHCFKCNKCYFAGRTGSFKCPCEEGRVSFIDLLGSFLSDLHGPESDNDYY